MSAPNVGTLAGFGVGPPPIFRVGPPYDRIERLGEFPDAAPVERERGSVWLVSVPTVRGGWGTAAEWVLRLRSAYPTVAVGLLLHDADPQAFDAARASGMPRVRAILRQGEPVARARRERMTRPADLGAEVTEWLGLLGLPLPPRTATPIRAIFDDDRRFLAGIHESLNVSERTLRRRFARCGLPPPMEWHAAARALHAVLRVQGEQATSVLRIALEAGYSDQSSLSRQTNRLFHLRPGETRPTLGWEWVLWQWVNNWAPHNRGRNAGSMTATAILRRKLAATVIDRAIG